MKNANPTPVRTPARFALLTGDLLFKAMLTTDAAWAAMTPRERRTTRKALLVSGVVRLLKAERTSGSPRAVEVSIELARQLTNDSFLDVMAVGEAMGVGAATIVRFA
jgi:hypothetical protein